jgi:hypothetical protein
MKRKCGVKPGYPEGFGISGIYSFMKTIFSLQ